MPEFKIVKPSDTQWLAHERCVKVVKENYCVIVIALNKHMSQKHWSKKSTILAMFLLDYQVAKLSKTLQTEKLDVTVISSLVEATLHSIRLYYCTWMTFILLYWMIFILAEFSNGLFLTFL